ncbi:MAG: methyltransferase domain-containing protein [Balneolaceae bacterium]|nr:MAG: methyltransferase domain-containing protein [Balneolaceae bacterium]
MTMNITFSIPGLALVTGFSRRVASKVISMPVPFTWRWLEEKENPFLRNYRTERIISRLGLKPGMRVLDAGCCGGRLTIPVARMVGPAGHVTALDVQEESIISTRMKAESHNISNIRYLNAASGICCISENEFDRVLLVSVLGELTDREEAMGIMYRSLKPGGMLSVTEIITDPHYLSHTTVARLATMAGFQEKAVYGNRMTYTFNFVKPDNSRNTRKMTLFRRYSRPGPGFGLTFN